MSLSSRPVQPVPPESMELVFFLSLPRLWAPQPSDCADAAFHDPLRVLRGPFPVMPVDERTVHYVKIMLANGRAALDPDFA